MSEIQLTSDHAKRLDEVELLNNGVVVAKVGFAFELYLSNGQAGATRLALCKNTEGVPCPMPWSVIALSQGRRGPADNDRC